MVPRRVEQTVGLKAKHLAVTTGAEKAGLRADHSAETTAAKWVVCLELRMAAPMVGWMVSRLDSEPVDRLEHQMVGSTVGQTVACLVVSLVEPKAWQLADLKDPHWAVWMA